MAGERERLFAKYGKAKRRFEIGDMDNQRIETRAPLCLEDARYRPALCGVRAEPIHCLSRERGQAARTNNLRGLFNRRLVRLNDHAISAQRRRQKRKSNVTIPEINHFPALYNKSVAIECVLFDATYGGLQPAGSVHARSQFLGCHKNAIVQPRSGYNCGMTLHIASKKRERRLPIWQAFGY